MPTIHLLTLFEWVTSLETQLAKIESLESQGTWFARRCARLLI
jgi:hypothetical protein